MNFDPEKTRRGLLAEGRGLLRWYVERSASTTSSPLGNTACSDLSTTTYAWLVGLSDEIAPVIPRALEWLDHGIENFEVMGNSKNFHQMQLRSARAIGKWMEHGVNSDVDWATAVTLELGYWADEPNSVSWTVRQCLDDYMAFVVQSGNYTQGIETFERLVGIKKPTLGQQVKPREYAYAVCLAKANGEYDEEELFSAGRRMLQANLDENWLGTGQSLRAATWLKIVYWDRDWRVGRSPQLTPLQTILKAYENMPKVLVPDYIHLD